MRHLSLQFRRPLTLLLLASILVGHLGSPLAAAPVSISSVAFPEPPRSSSSGDSLFLPLVVGEPGEARSAPPVDDTLEASPAAGTPRLKLSKRAEPIVALSGGMLTYVVEVVNAGEAAVKDLLLSDDLSAGLTVVEGSVQGFTYDEWAHRLTWAVSELGRGERLECRFQVRVQGFQPGEVILNSVEATAGEPKEVQQARVETLVVQTMAETVWVTPEEGGLLRSADGQVEVRIPPGAMQDRTRVTYTPRPDIAEGTADRPFAFDLEAENEAGQAVREFAAPLELLYRYTMPPATPPVYREPELFLLDEETGHWLPLGAEMDEEAGVLRLQLPHFSTYSEGSTSYVMERMSSLRGARTNLFSLSAGYSHGFEIPPGVRGLAPTVGLSYSSASHTPNSGHLSYAGYGWQMVGADSVYIPPGDANTFKRVLTLQGATYTLRKTSDGTWFAKENPFLKITESGGHHYTPDTVNVWTPDGTKYTFGGSSVDAVYYWKGCSNPSVGTGERYVRLPLAKIEDTSGNIVNYSWEAEVEGTVPYDCEVDTGWQDTHEHQRATRLTEITYDNDDLVKIAFSYGSRLDRPSGYDSASWRFHTEKKLTSVSVQIKDGAYWRTVRTYTLTHNAQNETQAVSQKVLNLDKIQESSGASNWPVTEFDYSDDYFVTEGEYGSLTEVSNGYGGEVTFSTSHRDGGSTPHVVSSRTEDDGISGTSDAVWSYTGSDWDSDGGDWWLEEKLAEGYEEVQVTLPDSTVEKHYFHVTELVSSHLIDHRAGREHKLEISEGSQELARTETTWSMSTSYLPISGYSSMNEWEKPRFVYVSQVDSYLDGDKQTRTKYQYQKWRQGGTYVYGNVTEQKEYGSSTGSSWDTLPLRTTYTWYYPNHSSWIVNKPGRSDFYRVCSGCEDGAMERQWLLYYDQTSSYTTSPSDGLLKKREDKSTSGGSYTVTTTFDHWSNGNLKQVSDSNGNDTYTFFDDQFEAFAVCTKNEKGHTTKFRYYGVEGSDESGCTTTDGSAAWSGGSPVSGRFFGRLEESKDANDVATTYRYDALGRLDEVWLWPDSSSYPTVELAYANYSSSSSPYRVETKQRETAGQSGQLVSNEIYDGFGRVIQSRSEGPTWTQPTVSSVQYDGLGRVEKQSVPYWGTVGPGTFQPPSWGSLDETLYAYEGLGRVITRTLPDSSTMLNIHDGRDTTVVDEENHQVVYESDAFGRLIVVKEYTGTYPSNLTLYATTTYTYNAQDQLVEVEDEDGNVTAVSYDGLGRKTAMDDPDMGEWDYGYDSVGNLTRQDDAEGQRTCFYYDGLNRLEGKYYTNGSTSCPSSPTYDVSYSYDSGTYGKGQRTSMTISGVDTTSWIYDQRGRVIEESKIISGTGGGTFVTEWAYDSMDRVTEITYPDDEEVEYTYTAQGLVNGVSGTSTYVLSTAYDALGRAELRKLGSDVMRQDYIYFPWSTADGQGRLRYLKTGTSSTPTSRQHLEYGYDSVGNVTQIKDYNAGGTQTQSFSYDPLDRLVSAGASGGTGGTYSETYGVDELGNLTSKGGVSYTYGTQSSSCADGSLSKPHAAVAVGSDAYCYDHNGNQTKRTIGGTTYTLTYDEENRLTGVSGGASASFVYDGDGVRIKGTVGGTTTIYVGEHYEKTGSGVSKYYYANGQRVAVRRSGYGSDNNLFWLLTDHLGSTAVTLWPGGAKKAELRYKAFGETRYTSSSTPTTFRYTGQREESAIGLYFYRGRWYDVVLGRFVQADTIVPDPANPQSLNRFSYVLNNPVRYTDPTGHWEFEDDPNDVTFIVSPNRSFTGTPVGVVNPDDIASFEPSTLGETLFLGASPLLVFAGAAGAEAVLVPAAGTGWMWLLEALGFACADGDCTNEGEAGVGGLSRAAEFGIRTLRELRALSAGTALERHHIIEQRFADTLGQNALDMLGVALTPEEHQALTNAWRALIGYSNSSNPLNTLTATRQDIWLAAQEIYASYPALLEAARQQLFGG